MYIPECYSSIDEMVYILQGLKEGEKPITAHIRGEGDSLVKSVEEVVEIAKRLDVPLQISHFKSCGTKNWGKEIFKAMKIIEDARENALQISCDFYPYEGGSTTLTSMLSPEFVRGNLREALKRLGTIEGVEEFRRLSQIEYKDWDNYVVSLGWDKMIISAVEKDEFVKMKGLSIEEASKKFGYKDAVELAARLMHKEDGKVTIVIMSMSPKDVEEVAKLPYASVISDALYADTSTPHPRLYGAFPKIIREFVVEKNILKIEEAIEKMTSKPANFMGIYDRGRVKVGAFADLIIFDKDKFKDRANFQKGNELASGLDFCIINGTIMVENGICQIDIKNGKFIN